MEKNHPVSELMAETIEKIKEAVDANTVVGEPIVAGEITLIPVSKISLGFGTGGSEMGGKTPKIMGENPFGGGGGAGVTVSPVCFLIIGRDGSANILGINAQASDTVDRLVEMIPGAINKVSNFVSGFKGKTEDAAEVAEPLSGDE